MQGTYCGSIASPVAFCQNPILRNEINVGFFVFGASRILMRRTSAFRPCCMYCPAASPTGWRAAAGWLLSSGGRELVRNRCDPAAATPHGGSEPMLAYAAQFTNVRSVENGQAGLGIRTKADLHQSRLCRAAATQDLETALQCRVLLNVPTK